MGNIKERMQISKEKNKCLWELYNGKTSLHSKLIDNAISDITAFELHLKNCKDVSKLNKHLYFKFMIRVFQLSYDLDIKDIQLTEESLGVESFVNINCFSAINLDILMCCNNESITYSRMKSVFERDINGNSISDSKQEKISDKQKTYIMKDSKNNLYKIGKSVNPKFREKTLQSQKPTIQVLAICEELVESQIHKEYDFYRVRGEWFKLNPKQLQDIITKYKFNFV